MHGRDVQGSARLPKLHARTGARLFGPWALRHPERMPVVAVQARLRRDGGVPLRVEDDYEAAARGGVQRRLARLHDRALQAPHLSRPVVDGVRALTCSTRCTLHAGHAACWQNITPKICPLWKSCLPPRWLSRLAATRRARNLKASQGRAPPTQQHQAPRVIMGRCLQPPASKSASAFCSLALATFHLSSSLSTACAAMGGNVSSQPLPPSSAPDVCRQPRGASQPVCAKPPAALHAPVPGTSVSLVEQSAAAPGGAQLRKQRSCSHGDDDDAPMMTPSRCVLARGP